MLSSACQSAVIRPHEGSGGHQPGPHSAPACVSFVPMRGQEVVCGHLNHAAVKVIRPHEGSGGRPAEDEGAGRTGHSSP